MAREFIDGFESGGLGLWNVTIAGGKPVIISTSGLDMDGSYCVDMNTGSSAYLQRGMVAASEKYFAFRYRPANSSAGILIWVYKDATCIGHLRRYTVTGVVQAYVGTSSLVASGTIPMSINTTHRIELYYKIADSGGRIVVKINGVIDIDFTGDTKPGADTTMNSVYLGGVPAMAPYCYFDNLVIDDAAYPGNTRIQGIVPTGAGNLTQWTPSAGSNWDCVEEVPPSDTDYVSINSVDQVDLYGMGSLVGSIGSIQCVQVQARCVKEGTPTPQNIQLAVRSGGTNYFSGNKAVPTVVGAVCNLWAVNPNTSNPWTQSGVDDMEAGIKSVT